MPHPCRPYNIDVQFDMELLTAFNPLNVIEFVCQDCCMWCEFVTCPMTHAARSGSRACATAGGSLHHLASQRSQFLMCCGNRAQLQPERAERPATCCNVRLLVCRPGQGLAVVAMGMFLQAATLHRSGIWQIAWRARLFGAQSLDHAEAAPYLDQTCA